ncbi:hypothetical protein K9L27_01685 [Candidatus Gracilibacteria bacterium]|nr:hypothetical protein [Candidatus Gracilibacteria bacterium]
MNSDPTAVVPPVYYETPGAITTSPLGSGVSNAFGGALQTVNNFSVMELVQMFIVYAFIIAGALSAVFIFVGGVSFILSGGNDEKIKSAVNTIRYSIVGLIVTILSFTFIMIVGRIFGLNLIDYVSYDQIKCSINRLVQFGEAPSDNSCQSLRLRQ